MFNNGTIQVQYNIIIKNKNKFVLIVVIFFFFLYGNKVVISLVSVRHIYFRNNNLGNNLMPGYIIVYRT